MKSAKITLSVILFVLAFPIAHFQMFNVFATSSFVEILEAMKDSNFAYDGIEAKLLSSQLLMMAEFFTWLISFPLCIATGIIVLVGIKKRRSALLCGILLATFFILNCITGGIHYYIIYLGCEMDRYLSLSFTNTIFDKWLIEVNWTLFSNILLVVPMIGFIICGILDKTFNKTNQNTFSQPVPEHIVTTPTALYTAPTSTPTTVAPPVNYEESVKKLKVFKDLLDQGIITQEEFDRKKKQLLDI